MSAKTKRQRLGEIISELNEMEREMAETSEDEVADLFSDHVSDAVFELTQAQSYLIEEEKD